jgi:competence protein ComGC
VVAIFILVFMCGIMVAIAIPVFNAAKMNALKKSCYANERTIEGAALTYQAENNELPGSISDVVPDYIAEEPVCPVAGPYDYDPETGTADCVEHGHY